MPDDSHMAAADPLPGPDAPRRLTRSTSEKYVAGVAGGLGRYFDIDPTIFRVMFGVSILFGGIGILAYLAMIAFVPTDDGEPAWIEGRSRTTTIVVIAVLVIAGVSSLSPPTFILGPGLFAVVAFTVLGVGLYRAFGGERGDDPARIIARVLLVLLVLVAALGAATGIGFIAAIGGGVAIAGIAMFAGFALIAAGLLGGPRWLILPVIVLVLPLAVVSASDVDLTGGVGERTYNVASLGDLPPQYRLGVGHLIVDMRGLKLPPGRTELNLRLGMGEAVVHPPDGACVSSDVKIGVGAADLPDRAGEGRDVDIHRPRRPAPGQPELVVNADVGVGHVQVYDPSACA